MNGEQSVEEEEEAGITEQGDLRSVLATYKVEGSKMLGGQGRFSIRREAVASNADEEKQWELIVLLTGLGIIEAARRSARGDHIVFGNSETIGEYLAIFIQK